MKMLEQQTTSNLNLKQHHFIHTGRCAPLIGFFPRPSITWPAKNISSCFRTIYSDWEGLNISYQPHHAHTQYYAHILQTTHWIKI